MSNAVLEVSSLSHTYPDGTEAVREVSLAVFPAEIVGLIGPSGAGKSTILRCINRLIRPKSGKLHFLGKEVGGSYAELLFLRRKIGMIFQEFNLIPNLSVLMNVLLGRLSYQAFWRQAFCSFSRRDNEIALSALFKVGMLEFRRKKARELSGGQKQRVGIARALAQEPTLLLADEPVSNLDPLTAEQILEHFVNLCREANLAAIINLHSVELAKNFCDRIYGVSEGTIVFEGKPSELSPEVVSKIYSKA